MLYFVVVTMPYIRIMSGLYLALFMCPILYSGQLVCGTRPETGLHSCPRLLSYYGCHNVLVSVSSITVLGHGGLVMKGKGCLEVAWIT